MLIDVTTASLSGYTYKADQKFNSITATSGSFSNLTVSGTITANSQTGTLGQVLTSTASGVQWSTISSTGSNIFLATSFGAL
jgi:hypothetical protein